ncbi:hypothetical protein [Flavisolibacter ginsengisoli]|jgi:hypothetical protein|nr:hypothetical protein [Flavisolibacter ginsengisoli]
MRNTSLLHVMEEAFFLKVVNEQLDLARLKNFLACYNFPVFI